MALDGSPASAGTSGPGATSIHDGDNADVGRTVVHKRLNLPPADLPAGGTDAAQQGAAHLPVALDADSAHDAAAGTAVPPTRSPADLDPDRWGLGGGFAPPPDAPPPALAPMGSPAPPRRSRRRNWLIAAVVVVLAAGGAVTGFLVTGNDDPVPTKSPTATVQAYLHALATGDAATALAQGTPQPSTGFLTDGVLRQQQSMAPLSDVQVEPVRPDGDHATVPVRYRFGSHAASVQTYSLTRTGGVWRLDQTAFKIDVSMVGKLPALTLFGQAVSGKGIIEVFPGPLQWGTNNRFFTVIHGDRFPVSPTDSSATYTELDAPPNALGKKTMLAATQRYVQACGRSRSLKPKHCPQQELGTGAVDNTAKWALTTPVAKKWHYVREPEDLTTFDITGNLRWTCVYTARLGKKKTKRTVTDKQVEGALQGTIDMTSGTPSFRTTA